MAKGGLKLEVADLAAAWLEARASVISVHAAHSTLSSLRLQLRGPSQAGIAFSGPPGPRTSQARSTSAPRESIETVHAEYGGSSPCEASRFETAFSLQVLSGYALEPSKHADSYARVEAVVEKAGPDLADRLWSDPVYRVLCEGPGLSSRLVLDPGLLERLIGSMLDSLGEGLGVANGVEEAGTRFRARVLRAAGVSPLSLV